MERDRAALAEIRKTHPQIEHVLVKRPNSRAYTLEEIEALSQDLLKEMREGR